MTTQQQQQLFEKWLDKHKGLFFKVVRSYAHTRMDQEDLFQEIAVQVWNAAPTFRHESSITTWLYRISLNTAIKWMRKESRYSQPMHFVLQDIAGEEDERLTWLYEAIYQLDAVDKSIALLLLDGFSYKNMAAILGITESNVGVKINRIKKHLISQSNKTNDYGI